LRLLVTGACGFVGSSLIQTLITRGGGHTIFGLDNLIRPGSESNRAALKAMGVRVVHADIRCASDFESLPAVDAVIDAAANPSVLAGIDGATSSRQLVEHNLHGTVNMLEYCRRQRAAFVLLSTSRVYSISPLSSLRTRIRKGAFEPDPEGPKTPGLSAHGLDETFSTAAPVSLYGATKLASEVLALEYGSTFGFPVWINRCGVLAGPGQFGRADQGIFAYWINSWLRRRKLKYIGFDGMGHQVRDCLHPKDLGTLIERQLKVASPDAGVPRVLNVSGGQPSAMSLRTLSDWCRDRFGDHTVESDPLPRPFDIPWMVLDSRLAESVWDFRPEYPTMRILEEIAIHAEAHPDWLDLSAP
jgi:CDP-paratose 2-epimerase